MSSRDDNEEVRGHLVCPPDPRFHNQNVTAWCFNLFVDYQKCTRLLGKDHAPCEYFYKCFHSICPNAWITKWEEQLEDGTFPLKLPEPQKENPTP